MKRHRQSLVVNSDMNITNLLDVALTLLCGFMIVAPTLQSGIPVDLPAVENSQTINADENNTANITIGARDPESVEDKIYLDGQRVRVAELTERLQELKASKPDLSVTIDADQRAWMDTGVQVLAAANLAGIENFAFATNPNPRAAEEDEKD